MREILFRGKDIKTGEWIYGGVVHQTDFYGDKTDKYFIIDGTTTQDYDIGEIYRVDPKTVSQYIGVKDKKGKRIFEGDILYDTNKYLCEERYRIFHPMYGMLWKSGNDVYNVFEIRDKQKLKKDLKIIGNKWDGIKQKGEIE